MITTHEYQDCQISVQCREHRLSAQQSAWSASFQYTRKGHMVQQFVQACARQKSAQAARDKALRFAIIAIDARAESRTLAPEPPRGARRAGALERIADTLTPPAAVLPRSPD